MYKMMYLNWWYDLQLIEKFKIILHSLLQKKNKGIVMVSFTPIFITCNNSNSTTVRDVAGKTNFSFMFVNNSNI